MSVESECYRIATGTVLLLMVSFSYMFCYCYDVLELTVRLNLKFTGER